MLQCFNRQKIPIKNIKMFSCAMKLNYSTLLLIHLESKLVVKLRNIKEKKNCFNKSTSLISSRSDCNNKIVFRKMNLFFQIKITFVNWPTQLCQLTLKKSPKTSRFQSINFQMITRKFSLISCLLNVFKVCSSWNELIGESSEFMEQI